jgi:hypothetical protein
MRNAICNCVQFVIKHLQKGLKFFMSFLHDFPLRLFGSLQDLVGAAVPFINGNIVSGCKGKALQETQVIFITACKEKDMGRTHLQFLILINHTYKIYKSFYTSLENAIYSKKKKKKKRGFRIWSRVAKYPLFSFSALPFSLPSVVSRLANDHLDCRLSIAPNLE